MKSKGTAYHVFQHYPQELVPRPAVFFAGLQSHSAAAWCEEEEIQDQQDQGGVWMESLFVDSAERGSFVNRANVGVRSAFRRCSELFTVHRGCVSNQLNSQFQSISRIALVSSLLFVSHGCFCKSHRRFDFPYVFSSQGTCSGQFLRSR